MKRMVVLTGVMLLLVGCVSLTPEQSAKLNAAVNDMQELSAEAIALSTDFRDTLADYRAGRLTFGEAIPRLQSITSRIKATKYAYDDVEARYKQLQELQVPWYHIAAGLLAAVISAMTGIRIQRRKTDMVSGALDTSTDVNDALIRGVERGEKRYEEVIDDLVSRLPEEEREKLLRTGAFSGSAPVVVMKSLVKGSVTYEAGKAGVTTEVAAAVSDVVG